MNAIKKAEPASQSMPALAPKAPSIALYKEAEVALSTAGIGLDWGGWGYESLPASQIAEIVDAFTRLEMKQRFARAVCWVVEIRPAMTYDNFARDFGERFVLGYKRPSAMDLLKSHLACQALVNDRQRAH